MKKRFSFYAVMMAALLFLATPAHAAPGYYDGYFTNLLVKGYLAGSNGETLDNTTDGYWTVTLPAAGLVYLPAGNLKVGNGVPDAALNGDDAYIKGTLEVDGVPRFDAATMILRGVTYTIPAADAAGYLRSNGSGTWSWDAGTSGSLDDAYNSGATITADAGAVTINNNAANNNGALAINKSPVGAQSGDAVTVTVGANSTGDALQFANSGTGYDINGSGGLWYITKTGAATFASGTFTTLYQTAIAAAAAGNVNLSVDAAGNGTITIGGISTGATNLPGAVVMNGNVDIGNAATDTLTITSIIDGNVTLDDGATDSPSLIFKDATDETATLKKTDGANLDLTTTATEGLRIMVGNLRVGDGAPGTAAMDGEDFYVNGASEFDGAVQMDGNLTAAGTVTINNASVTLYNNEAITLTHASNGAGDDLTLQLTGANDSSIILDSAGTGTDAISLQASAGGVDIDAAAAKDVNIAGGQVALVSKDDAASAISLTANVGVSETIVVTNTQGTGEGAITLTSTAGGVDIDAAAAKNIDVAGGQVLISSKDNAASAIALTANTGADETIVVTNTQGTGEGAITLTSTAGGVDIDAAAAKNIDVSGGQVLISSKDNAASAIALTANTGANETIVVTNTQGNTAGAITLTATAGGITLNAASGITTGDAITGDGTAALGGFLKTVANDVDAHTVTVAESGTVLTNAGNDGDPVGEFTLPEGTIGLNYCFVVMAAQELRVIPPAGDAINIAGAQGDAAEYWTANAIGESLCIVKVDVNNWVALSYTGTWTQQTP